MGLFQILRSIEELLYEVMTWLVFYPRTLWRIVRHPVAVIDYSDQEQVDTADDQYVDLLSPPLFLLLSIVLMHGLEVSLHASLERPAGSFGKILGSSEESLLVVRAVLFSIYPLMFAVGVLKRSATELNRKTLRSPFFSQCYLGALFAVLVSGATILGQAKFPYASYVGGSFSFLAVVWFVSVEAAWFAEHLKVSRWRGTLLAIRTFVKASLINGVIAAIVLV